MDLFIKQSESERRVVFEEAATRLDLPAVSIEKDFWVCWTLGELFSLPSFPDVFYFKGGTSLSKAWKLIERFSEDIDVVIDRKVLGFDEESGPEATTSNKQRRKRLKSLSEASVIFVRDQLLPVLTDTFSGKLSEDFQLYIDSVDAQSILFAYPSVFAHSTSSYLRREVKIELGARSEVWPTEERSIQPYVAEAIPDYFEKASVSVSVINPMRTCLDKMLLLHEENFRPKSKTKKERLSRHYYDLYRLIEAGVAEKALVDKDLLAKVIKHRSVFFGYTWMNYESFSIEDFKIMPSEESLVFWKADYEKMRTEMFFGNPPVFADLLKVIEHFQTKVLPQLLE